MGIIEYLVAQSGNPNGVIGKLLLRSMERVHGSIIRRAVARIENGTSMRVLDIGTGNGVSIEIMDRYFSGGSITGIDISETAVREARKRIRNATGGNTIVVERGDVSRLDCENESFEVITAFQSHYFRPDLDTTMKTVVSKLAKGGFLVLTGDINKLKYHRVKYVTPEENAVFLSSLGMSIAGLETHNGFLICVGRKIGATPASG